MLMRRANDIDPSEITPEALYRNRRQWMRAAGAAGVAAAAAGLLRPGRAGAAPAPAKMGPPLEFAVPGAYRLKGEEPTPWASATTYNNFYELGTGKEDPAQNAGALAPRPWTVAVEGEVHKPQRFGVEDLLKTMPLEERVYRLRCVEAWSMVIPWVGFPLRALLDRVEPTGKAKYVAFETVYDPQNPLPGQRRAILDWPYVEGLRLDEARHDLTLLAVGMYGRVLPNQNGAPIRLVVPWKYGFKSIKSIVRLRLTATMPPTSWNRQAPQEYGFFANVNPTVDHPRWRQSKERRIGEFFKRDTLMFNGYAAQVAGLYQGMDLRTWY